MGSAVTILCLLLNATKPAIINFLKNKREVKVRTKLITVMNQPKIDENGEIVRNYQEEAFHSGIEVNLKGTDADGLYDKMVSKMLEDLSKFTEQGSGWRFQEVIALHLYVDKYNPLRGSGHIPLPKALAGKKAIINMKNGDDKCFLWCVLRALNKSGKHDERIDNDLRSKESTVNMTGIEYPVTLSDIKKFEKNNPGIFINVFGFNSKEKIYPLFFSKQGYDNDENDEKDKIINLLLIEKEGQQHYCLIKNMSRLTSSQYNNHKSTRHFCFRCLNSFQNVDSLRKHVEYRSEHGTVKIKMPVKGTKCYFKHHGKKIPVPFAIYADFETFLKPIDTCQPNPWKSYTNRYHVHIPSAFSYFIKCFDDEVYLKPPTVYTAKSVGENVAEIFFNRLKDDVKIHLSQRVEKGEAEKDDLWGGG